jgi:hypothetical protein
MTDSSEEVITGPTEIFRSVRYAKKTATIRARYFPVLLTFGFNSATIFNLVRRLQRLMTVSFWTKASFSWHTHLANLFIRYLAAL